MFRAFSILFRITKTLAKLIPVFRIMNTVALKKISLFSFLHFNLRKESEIRIKIFFSSKFES